ncbi:P-loop nucleoside triphosphate hydrolasessuperfamily protein with CH (Calponin Homology) domain [Striga asiatica]|uniref:P-loop nucleoside triphosphate hydrolasessuperfamily protein with CH (Calponin Homology) domain n=1 Tax=Striga asiatica TaxID=4170 RepID=A0A5A7R7V4_STRAF|nr:P-loop nucleoside triphosphate hydrolasessuperfamily protein with CH (Calponin Homology) domain [Striga asiatica]
MKTHNKTIAVMSPPRLEGERKPSKANIIVTNLNSSPHINAKKPGVYWSSKNVPMNKFPSSFFLSFILGFQLGSHHNHGNHTGKEEDDHQRVGTLGFLSSWSMLLAQIKLGHQDELCTPLCKTALPSYETG